MTSKGDDINHDSVEWAGVTIDYNWCHSRRKTLGISGEIGSYSTPLAALML